MKNSWGNNGHSERLDFFGLQNNFRCANDTTLMAENEEELKSFLMKVKEESENVKAQHSEN